MLPNQTEPEHWHPPVGRDPGKEETVRMIWGDLRFYIDGPDTLKEGFVVQGKQDCYTVRHELIMRPGDQMTLRPGQKHWFQGGSLGAVLFSFSSCVRDVLDGFTNPAIVRQTVVVDDPIGT
jgi:D-lyxose ketol-isomerase